MLMSRLSAAILAWKDCLLGDPDVSIDTSMDTTPHKVTAQFRPGGTPQVEVRDGSTCCMYGSFSLCLSLSPFPLSPLSLPPFLPPPLPPSPLPPSPSSPPPPPPPLSLSLSLSQSISHELHITNQLMHLQPPLELSRCHLISQLHKWISTVTGLQRIQSTRYQVQEINI